MTRWVKCTDPSQSRYEIVEDGKAILMSPCGVKSYSQGDIQHGYCAFCDKFIQPKDAQ